MDKLAEEISQSLEAIFKNTERIHGKSEALDWIKIASIHASRLLIERYPFNHESKLKEELRSFLVYHDLKFGGDYNKLFIIEFIDEYLKQRNK